MFAMADHGATDVQGKKSKKGKLLLIAVPVLLLAVGAGGWFSGIIPSMLGHKAGAVKGGRPEIAPAAPPVYVDVPEIVANLNVPGKRPSYLKLHAKLELSARSDEAAVSAAMPRIQDLFQTYLREMRPEELRGSAGSYRLREELIGRATIAACAGPRADVLFTEC